MAYANIAVEREGRVALVILQRPEKLNAMDEATKREVLEALGALAADDGVGVVVFTGAGEKAFAAGADVQEFARRTPGEQQAVMEALRFYEAVASFPKPTIAMVNGYCLGGGCELALACDLRVASETAQFGQTEIRLGLIPGGGGSQRLPRLVGPGQALRLILTGEMVGAREAERIGLVEAVVPASELRAFTLGLAQGIAGRSPLALRLAKEAVAMAAQEPLDEGLRREAKLFLLAFSSPEARRGIEVFLARKKDGKG
jgi:enoyl-CoA hydratase